MAEELYELPDGWEWSTIGTVSRVNQRDPKLRELPNDLTVTFVPMAAVEEKRGMIETPQVRPLGEVRKGFTPFADGDVIFARITPCMENGKAAIARHLTNGLGFGSTEFHVMRPNDGILPDWIFHYVSRQEFRNEAKANFTGTAGQLRVPAGFIRNAPIPVAPIDEQHRIVAKIDQLFAESRTAREALDKIPPLIKRFRQSVLAKAFRGELTERDPNDEPASVLLERIRAERRRKWEEDVHAKGKDPKQAKYVEPEPADTSDLLELPAGWEWTALGDMFEVHTGGTPSRKRPDYWNGKIPWVSSSEVAFCRIKDTREKITKAGSENSSAKVHPIGTVLLAMIGEGKTRGQSAILDIAAANNQNAAAILCSKTPIPSEYVFYWLMCRYEETRGGGQGGAQPALNGQRVRQIPLPLAPLAEQRRIVAKIEALFAQADAIERAVDIARRRAEKVDQSILARAFRGEL